MEVLVIVGAVVLGAIILYAFVKNRKTASGGSGLGGDRGPDSNAH